MGTKHTPGPWEVENAKAPHTHHRWRIGSVSKPIAAVLDTPSGKEEIANAHLIAAAPDLLEACKAAYTSLIAQLGPHHEITEQVGAAIAKAEGHAEDAPDVTDETLPEGYDITDDGHGPDIETD